MNIIAQSLVTAAEQEELRKIEQIKRKGHKFFRLINESGNVMRLHAIDTISAHKQIDSKTGQEEWIARQATGIMEFRIDPLTGDQVCDVLDTQFNRFFVSRHIDLGLKVADEKIAEEIRRLIDTPYEVELSEEAEIEREIAAQEKKLEEIRQRKRDELLKKQKIAEDVDSVMKQSLDATTSEVDRVVVSAEKPTTRAVPAQRGRRPRYSRLAVQSKENEEPQAQVTEEAAAQLAQET